MKLHELAGYCHNMMAHYMIIGILCDLFEKSLSHYS